MEILSLQNDLLHVQISPSFGGKIVSLRSIRTGEEFLLPPIKGYARVTASEDFSKSDGGGFDECLPSVASCESNLTEPPIPDHGDLWRMPWHVDAEDNAIVLHADATSRPLRLTRTATLDGATLVLEYDLVNLSYSPTSWLWSAHPLLRVDAGDRILLPDEIKEVAVEYSAHGMLDRGTSVHWPTTLSSSHISIDLSKMPAQDDTTAHKLFARMGKSGWAALYREKIRQGILVRFRPTHPSLPRFMDMFRRLARNWGKAIHRCSRTYDIECRLSHDSNTQWNIPYSKRERTSSVATGDEFDRSIRADPFRVLLRDRTTSVKMGNRHSPVAASLNA